MRKLFSLFFIIGLLACASFVTACSSPLAKVFKSPKASPPAVGKVLELKSQVAPAAMTVSHKYLTSDRSSASNLLNPSTKSTGMQDLKKSAKKYIMRSPIDRKYLSPTNMRVYRFVRYSNLYAFPIDSKQPRIKIPLEVVLPVKH